MGSPTTQAAQFTAPSSGNIVVGHAFLNGVVLAPSGVVSIFDNIAASGKIIFQYTNLTANTVSVIFRNAVRCDIGLSYSLTGGNVLIYYGAT